jgi:hypothetical protein
MHWTSYLAYRRIYHPDSQIVGDVGCVGCGYNLRGLRVMGKCPECGAAIADSLYVLVKPALVAEALRSFAGSYATFFAFFLGCITLFQGWPLTVTMAVLGCGAIYRLWWTSVLHLKAELTNSPQLSSRARWWWRASILEVMMWCAWIAAAIVVWNMPTRTAIAEQRVLYFGAGWAATSLLNGLAGGRFGIVLASVLGYGWMVVEFRIQIATAIVALLASLFLPIVIPGNMAAAIIVSLSGLVAIAYIGALVMTWMTLHHASNAAESATETMEDALAGP